MGPVYGGGGTKQILSLKERKHSRSRVFKNHKIIGPFPIILKQEQIYMFVKKRNEKGLYLVKPIKYNQTQK